MRVRSTALLGIALAFSLILLLGVCGVPVVAAAGDPPADAATGADGPRSTLGSYMAARIAARQFDMPAAAAFYSKVLQEDPENPMLLDAALQAEASRANWGRAEALSRALVKVDPSNRVAQALLGIVTFKAGRNAEAGEHFKPGNMPPIGELTNVLARAWILQAQGRTDEALATIDNGKLPDAANNLVQYHRALLADVAGRTAEARNSYGRLWKSDQRILRVALAYARHAAAAGERKQAQSILRAYIERAKGFADPHARALLDEIAGGEQLPLLVATPQEGMAELFYWLGQQFSSEPVAAGTDPVTLRLGVVFLQMSLYLMPDQTFPLIALAGAQEAARHFDAANDAYSRVAKGSPLEVAINISKAVNLNRLERVEEAQALLDQVAHKHPRDIRPWEALGNLMRDHKRYAEAVEYYSKAIALIGKPESKHWTFFYARGTSYERLKKLSQAEADLQRSLKLSANQAVTLNYLGYTWIDHNRHLRKGLQMIEKAVRLKPNDGYIVDSLGWGHYRLGHYPEAVRYLEQAVGLRPEDPTLNDHLGDAYWRVGREREARFQWDQALKLNPEPEEAEKMRRKLEKGLPSAAPHQAKRGKSGRSADRAKRRSAGNAMQQP
ncbi:MAG TPA: tetratricopeptide repeat protein [Hyphomicrobiaceae bacterium]|nr:tetratricopeptide repeat protein [Hyphomicrobiaceae bacterium]